MNRSRSSFVIAPSITICSPAVSAIVRCRRRMSENVCSRDRKRSSSHGSFVRIMYGGQKRGTGYSSPISWSVLAAPFLGDLHYRVLSEQSVPVPFLSAATRSLPALPLPRSGITCLAHWCRWPRITRRPGTDLRSRFARRDAADMASSRNVNRRTDGGDDTHCAFLSPKFLSHARCRSPAAGCAA